LKNGDEIMTDPFQTDRLRLRAFEPDDLSALHAYLNYPELTGRRYISWRSPGELPLSKEQVENLLKRWSEREKEFHLAVTFRDDDTIVGHANCDWGWDSHCPEVDLVISPAYQFQGYGTEVLKLLLDYLFNHTPAHSVGSGMASWNQVAFEFAMKNGFTHSGTMRRVGFWDGQFFDWLGVDILRPEWLDRSKKGGA
jgi:RimJ/RimL family protein N-acetyltransferase